MKSLNLALLLLVLVETPFLLWSLSNIYNQQKHALISPLPSIFRLTENDKSNAISAPANPSEKGRILFVSDRSGNYEIYEMDLATQKSTNLTNNKGNDMNPQVSPDGKSIVFYSDRDGDNEIYQMELQTGSVTQLTTTEKNSHDYDPSFSPDGKSIVFKSTRDDTKGDIFIMNADGSDPKNLTPDRKDTEEWDPLFTIDGKKIMFVVRAGTDDMTDDMYIMNADGSSVTRMTENTVPDWYPSINPQDGSIAFISKQNPKDADDVFLRVADGDKTTQVTTLPGNDADPSWDLKGKRIIFINDNDKDYDMYLMNADGSNLRNLGNTPSDELSPIFLP